MDNLPFLFVRLDNSKHWYTVEEMGNECLPVDIEIVFLPNSVNALSDWCWKHWKCSIGEVRVWGIFESMQSLWLRRLFEIWVDRLRD